jgi:hypothetical protein
MPLGRGPLERGPSAFREAQLNLSGHGWIVLAICLLAALVSFPTGW